MPIKQVEYFYKEIKVLTAEVGRTNLVDDLVSLAKQGSKLEMKEFFQQFKLDNPELWKRFSRFYKEYHDAREPVIFCDNKNEREKYGLCLYNPIEVHPFNLIVLFALSNARIYAEQIWRDNPVLLQQALKDAGYPQIARFIKSRYIWSIFDLIYAFKE